MKQQNIEKILKELFENPTKIYSLRELARKTKLNPNTILNSLPFLEKEGIILKEKLPQALQIKLNFESEKTVQRKKLFNLKQIYESGIIEELKKEHHPTSIVLIGSYSRGEDSENSDIDIAIQAKKEEKINLSKYGKKLKRKIHLLILPKKYSQEFFNNLINGIVLYGTIEDERI